MPLFAVGYQSKAFEIILTVIFLPVKSLNSGLKPIRELADHSLCFESVLWLTVFHLLSMFVFQETVCAQSEGHAACRAARSWMEALRKSPTARGTHQGP